MTTSPRSPHVNVDDRCIAKTISRSSGMSSVYDCIISSLEYTTLANLFTLFSSTLKWGERGEGVIG